MSASVGLLVENRFAATGSSGTKTRSGSGIRQRTSQVNVRLLPSERDELEMRAADLGFTGPGRVQQYIRYLLDLQAAG